jgi:surface antigen
MNFKKSIALLLVASSLSACQPGQFDNMMTKENVGTLAGAGAGAWAGSNIGKGKGQIVGIAAGTLLGGYLGKSIGASLDKADMQQYHQTSQRALETQPVGQTATWTNPDSGNSGTITPTRTFVQNNQNCREYQQTISVGGKTERAFGTACRQPDGSWKIIQ